MGMIDSLSLSPGLHSLKLWNLKRRMRIAEAAEKKILFPSYRLARTAWERSGQCWYFILHTWTPHLWYRWTSQLSILRSSLRSIPSWNQFNRLRRSRGVLVASLTCSDKLIVRRLWGLAGGWRRNLIDREVSALQKVDPIGLLARNWVPNWILAYLILHSSSKRIQHRMRLYQGHL